MTTSPGPGRGRCHRPSPLASPASACSGAARRCRPPPPRAPTRAASSSAAARTPRPARRGNAPAGALWRDPDGRWRAAPGAAAARAVCGEHLDEDALEALQGRAPSFRRFAEAGEWLLAALGGAEAVTARGGAAGAAAKWSRSRVGGTDLADADARA